MAVSASPSFRPGPGSTGQVTGLAGLSPAPEVCSQTTHARPTHRLCSCAGCTWVGSGLIVWSGASWATSGRNARPRMKPWVGTGASTPEPARPSWGAHQLLQRERVLRTSWGSGIEALGHLPGPQFMLRLRQAPRKQIPRRKLPRRRAALAATEAPAPQPSCLGGCVSLGGLLGVGQHPC